MNGSPLSPSAAPAHEGPCAWLCGVTVFALGQASVANWGLLTPGALAWLAVSLIAGCAALLAPRRLRLRPGPEAALLGVLVALQAAQLVIELPVRPLDTTDTRVLRLACLVSATALLAAVLLAAGSTAARGGGRALFALSIAAWFAAQLWVLVHSVGVPIDVYLFQRDAVAGLLSGENPYRIHIPNLYGEAQTVYGPGFVKDGRLTYGCPYPPLSLLLVAPAQLLGDLRYAHLLATTLVAAAVGLLRPSTRSWLALGLYLFTPLGLCLHALAYTEVLVVGLLAATVLLPRERPVWLAVSFGLLLAVKQTLVFAPPLVMLLVPPDLRGRALARLAAVAVAVVVVVTVPIALWDPTEFWRSVVLFQFEQPFRSGCLSFLAALGDLLGREPPRALVLIPFVLAGLATWIALRTLRPGPASFSLALGVVLLVFFLFNKQAFPNYYLLVSGALCLAVIVDAPGAPPPPPAPAPAPPSTQ